MLNDERVERYDRVDEQNRGGDSVHIIAGRRPTRREV